jgi:hypothetical protein
MAVSYVAKDNTTSGETERAARPNPPVDNRKPNNIAKYRPDQRHIQISPNDNELK